MNAFAVIDGHVLFFDHIVRITSHASHGSTIYTTAGSVATRLPVREVMLQLCEAKRLYGGHVWGPWHYDYINGFFPKEIENGS